MTTEQQNIIALFNTKDPINMEIAEETAISTGNGVWFSNWINNKIEEVKSIITQYFNVEYLEHRVNMTMLHVIISGIYIEPFYDCVDIWTRSLILINENRNDLIGVKITINNFDFYTFQKELEEMGIKVNFVGI